MTWPRLGTVGRRLLFEAQTLVNSFLFIIVGTTVVATCVGTAYVVFTVVFGFFKALVAR